MTYFSGVTQKVSQWTNKLHCPEVVKTFCKKEEGALFGAAGGLTASLITRATDIFSGTAFGTIYGAVATRVDNKLRQMKPEWSGIQRIACANVISIPTATLALRLVGTTISPWGALAMGLTTNFSAAIWNAAVQHYKAAKTA